MHSLLDVLKSSDVVINLAAEHRDDVTPKSLYDEVNVQGGENVCKACSELGIKKIIFTSSVAVYGFAPIGTDETGEINYFNDYGRTKYLAEGKYRAWLKADSENSVIIIRPTVIFGEQNRGNFIITEELKMYYYRGIKSWKTERVYLRDTCLTGQDAMKAILDYFGIKYE